jgi:hypothetical protein
MHTAPPHDENPTDPVDHDDGRPAAPVAAPAGGPPPAPADEGPMARLRSRWSRDLRNALVDPAQQPTGDFDIVAQQLPSMTTDRVASFNSLITAMRLATTAISLLLVSSRLDEFGLSLKVWTAVVVSYAIFRAFKPIRYSDDLDSLLRVLFEVVLHVAAVVMTGYWDSPLIFMLLTAVTIAGLARGFGFAIRIAIVTVLAVSFPYVLAAADQQEALLQSASWGGIVMLVAIVAG